MIHDRDTAKVVVTNRLVVEGAFDRHNIIIIEFVEGSMAMEVVAVEVAAAETQPRRAPVTLIKRGF